MQLNYTYKYLKNGLNLIFIPIENTNFSKLEAITTVGAGSEPVSKQGITHLIEHISNSSSDKYSSTRELRKHMHKLGAKTSASTSDNTVRSQVILPSSKFSLGVDHMLDVITQSSFSQNIVDEQKKIIRNEIIRAENSPKRTLYYKFKNALIEGVSGYTLDRLGSLKALDRLQADEMHTYYQKLYEPSNIFFFVTGTFPKEEGDLLEERLLDLPRRIGHEIEKPVLQYVKKKTHYVCIPEMKNIFYQGVVLLEKDWLDDELREHLEFCCGLLEKMFYEYMRTENNLLYYIHTSIKSFNNDDFYLSITFESDVTNFIAIYNKFIEFFRKTVETGVSSEVIEEYIEFYVSSLEVSHLSEYSYSLELVDTLITGRDFVDINSRVQMATSSKVAHVNQVIAKYFSVDRLKGFYFGNGNDIKKLQQMM